jgi:hypothetical protein
MRSERGNKRRPRRRGRIIMFEDLLEEKEK